MSFPRAPDRLPDDMACAIGHAVSGFGFLEEALKRAIFSLTRHDLGADAPDDALAAWLRRMEDIADDLLGTLIDAFAAAARHGGHGDAGLELRLRRIRTERNLICHASWRPTPTEGAWRPTFINTRGEVFPDHLDAPAIAAIHEATLGAARDVIRIMRRTGIEGGLAGVDDLGDEHR